MQSNEPGSEELIGDERWFRQPSRRERWISAGLFVGFGVFFMLLFIVQRGWWFSWVVLGLGILSALRGFRDAIIAARAGDH